MFPFLSLQETLQQSLKPLFELPKIPVIPDSIVSSLSSMQIAKMLSEQNAITKIPTPSLDVIRASSLVSLSALLQESLRNATMTHTLFEGFRKNFELINHTNEGLHQVLLGIQNLAKAGQIQRGIATTVDKAIQLSKTASAMSYQVATLSVKEQAPEVVDELGQVSALSSELIAKASTQQPLTKEDLQELEKRFTTIVEGMVRAIHAKKSKSLLLVFILLIPSLLEFINNAYGTVQIAKNLSNPPSELATKDDVARMEKSLLETMRSFHSDRLIFMEATKATPLRLKPAPKSQILLRLEEGQEVFVVSRGAKWVQIRVIRNDGIAEFGWALKKYLRLSEQSDSTNSTVPVH